MALCISGLFAIICIDTYAIVSDSSTVFANFHLSVSQVLGCNKKDSYETETFLENYGSENFFNLSKAYGEAL
jgi:hypothetical protein